jgi:dTDP-4-dehydrorhamnose reductase
MRVLIVGGDGMLGHQLLVSLAGRHDVKVTLRQDSGAYRTLGLFDAENAFFGVDVRKPEALADVVSGWKPEGIVNAIGVVKQRQDAHDAVMAIEVNALFPHRLREMAARVGGRVVHLSTDCVFSGRKGNYTPDDVPDASDLYGRSKLLGEIGEPGGLTLRTSMIGLELSRKQGLVEWFLASRGKVKGFRRAIFSGLTTAELARLIERLLTEHRDLSGLWHAAAAPIDKYSLLSRLARELGRTDIEIVPDDALVCDRSLNGEAFTHATGYHAPSWDDMLRELAESVRRRGL